MKKIYLFFSILVITSLVSCKGSPKHTNKTVLNISGIGISEEETNIINNFKASHPDITIEINDYSKFGSEAITKLNLDISTGNIGDILVAGKYTDVNNLINKDLLWNLEEAAGFEELKNSIMPCIFETVKQDNGVYSLFPEFTINCYVSKSDILNEQMWDKENILSTLDSFIADKKNLFGEYSKSYMEDIFISLINDDIQNNNAKFEEDFYINLLDKFYRLCEIENFSSDIYSDDYNYRNNNIICKKEIIMNFDGFYTIEKGIFNSELSFLGIPTKLNTIDYSVSTEFSIFNSCKNKKEAWEFISYYFTDEYQTNLCYEAMSFPVNQKAIDRMYEMTLMHSYVNSNGENLGNKKNICVLNQSEIDIGIPQNEDMSKYMDLLTSIHTIGRRNYSVYKIILSTFDDFWNQKLTSEEAYSSIISSLLLYLSETE